jgi:hypothetical protein
MTRCQQNRGKIPGHETRCSITGCYGPPFTTTLDVTSPRSRCPMTKGTHPDTPLFLEDHHSEPEGNA